MSDGSVNGWGWRFTVYPIMPQFTDKELSDRSVMSGPSIELVTSLLEKHVNVTTDVNALSRLAAALASCAQLGSLGKILVNKKGRMGYIIWSGLSNVLVTSLLKKSVYVTTHVNSLSRLAAVLALSVQLGFASR